MYSATTAGAFRDPIYWFIAIFLVHFQLRSLSEAAAELLMKFINAIIEAFSARISQATGATTEPLFRLPTKLFTLRKYAGYGTAASNIIRYAVCPTCHKTFKMDELRLDQVVDAVDEILCDHKEFPLRNLSTCGQRRFKRSSGNRAVPIKVYTYKSVTNTLVTMLNRLGSVTIINLWRCRSVRPNVLYDVYDCRMWNELADNDRERFVDDHYSLLLTLNVDWFQPFSNGRIHSVGAIYLTINNLPRSERYKPENVILVGIMPGSKEPSKHQINHYLHPLVDELVQLYTGVSISVNAKPIIAFLQLSNLDEQAAIERQHGARWSELHRLSYFDAVRCTIIDPMHNLYSGTAKRVFNLWKMLIDAQTNRPLLSAHDFEKMGDQMGNTILPSGYDIPKGKLASGGTNFTSNEWRTWTLADFGPVYAFWLFGFERFNRLLQGTETNNKDGFEVTFIQKFLEKYSATDNLQHLQLSESAISVLTSLIPSLATVSSTSEDQSLSFFDIATFDQLATAPHSTCIGWEPLRPTLFSGSKMTDMIRLGKAHYDCLMGYYAGVYLNLCAEGVTSTNGKTMVINLVRKSLPSTFWDNPLENPTLRPGLVQYYFAHSIRLPRADGQGAEEYQHVFAFVRWYRYLQTDSISFRRHGMRVWRSSFAPVNAASILPVHRIFSPVGVSRWVDNNVVIIPLPRKLAA
ncbi:hypothetical protein VTP01DRAFT_781 [Rhizomucor pusillus]|uniref:uncharacterized protein n=1 Tax=Rhizomucor pusillus TaxID=4840 RepID=UPI003742FC71